MSCSCQRLTLRFHYNTGKSKGTREKKKKKDGEELQIVVKKILANSCLSLDRMFQP